MTLILLRKLKLGHRKPSTGPHAAHGLDIADVDADRGRPRAIAPPITVAHFQ